MTQYQFWPRTCNVCGGPMGIHEVVYDCPSCSTQETIRHDPPVVPQPGVVIHQQNAPEPANLKVLDSLWFSNSQGVYGIVLAEDTNSGSRRLYAGIAHGQNQSDDEKIILSWGNKVNVSMLREMLSRVTEEEDIVPHTGGSLAEIIERAQQN